MAKTARLWLAGQVSAAPRAAPMKGAVQGEATAAASTPVRKESSVGSRARNDAMPEGSTEPNSNTPARLRPMRVNNAASAAMVAGDCSWNPQPSCSPPARAAISTLASARKASTTPAAYASALLQRSRGSECCASARTLSDSTGNTQGMRLRIRPPRNANSSAVTKSGWLSAAMSVVLPDVAVGGPAAAVPAHGEVTFAITRRLVPSSNASTSGNVVGLSLRCDDNGQLARHRSPCQD